MPGRITVIGSANVDFVMPLPRLPKKGESVTGGPFTQTFGGKGSNQALAAARAGGRVAAVLNLGGEEHARRILDMHKRATIDTTHIRLNPGLGSGVGVIMVGPDGDNLIGTDLGANAFLSPEQVDAAEGLIAQSALVLLQMEVPQAANLRAIELARRHGARVLLNYAPAVPLGLVRNGDVDILVVNESEAESLTGRDATTVDGAGRAAAALARAGHRLVIVTLGEQGCLAWENGAGVHFPAFPVRAVDTTGAGDAFCGALATALAEEADVTQAIRFASAAGALSVTRPGATPSLPDRLSIENFLRNQSRP